VKIPGAVERQLEWDEWDVLALPGTQCNRPQQLHCSTLELNGILTCCLPIPAAFRGADANMTLGPCQEQVEGLSLARIEWVHTPLPVSIEMLGKDTDLALEMHLCGTFQAHLLFSLLCSQKLSQSTLLASTSL
jgi:hypothetical protein